MYHIEVKHPDIPEQTEVRLLDEAGRSIELPRLNSFYFRNGNTRHHGEVVLYLGTRDAFLPVSGWWHKSDPAKRHRF